MNVWKKPDLIMVNINCIFQFAHVTDQHYNMFLFVVFSEILRRFAETTENFIDNHKLKCYIFCMFNQQKLILPNGRFDQSKGFEAIEGLSSEDKLIILNSTRQCLYIMRGKEKDMCIKIYNFAVCTKKEDPERFPALYWVRIQR